MVEAREEADFAPALKARGGRITVARVDRINYSKGDATLRVYVGAGVVRQR